LRRINWGREPNKKKKQKRKDLFTIRTGRKEREKSPKARGNPQMVKEVGGGGFVFSKGENSSWKTTSLGGGRQNHPVKGWRVKDQESQRGVQEVSKRKEKCLSSG